MAPPRSPPINLIRSPCIIFTRTSSRWVLFRRHCSVLGNKVCCFSSTIAVPRGNRSGSFATFTHVTATGKPQKTEDVAWPSFPQVFGPSHLVTSLLYPSRITDVPSRALHAFCDPRGNSPAARPAFRFTHTFARLCRASHACGGVLEAQMV